MHALTVVKYVVVVEMVVLVDSVCKRLSRHAATCREQERRGQLTDKTLVVMDEGTCVVPYVRLAMAPVMHLDITILPLVAVAVVLVLEARIQLQAPETFEALAPLTIPQEEAAAAAATSGVRLANRFESFEPASQDRAEVLERHQMVLRPSRDLRTSQIRPSTLPMLWWMCWWDQPRRQSWCRTWMWK